MEVETAKDLREMSFFGRELHVCACQSPYLPHPKNSKYAVAILKMKRSFFSGKHESGHKAAWKEIGCVGNGNSRRNARGGRGSFDFPEYSNALETGSENNETFTFENSKKHDRGKAPRDPMELD